MDKPEAEALVKLYCQNLRESGIETKDPIYVPQTKLVTWVASAHIQLSETASISVHLRPRLFRSSGKSYKAMAYLVRKPSAVIDTDLKERLKKVSEDSGIYLDETESIWSILIPQQI
jgi:hypothetical protein